MARILIDHAGIRGWAAARSGKPAIGQRPGRGAARNFLQITFGGGVVDGKHADPVSWETWLTELDRQHLALRVIDEAPGLDADFELIDRDQTVQR